jgi:hypothetical protein
VGSFSTGKLNEGRRSWSKGTMQAKASGRHQTSFLMPTLGDQLHPHQALNLKICGLECAFFNS